MSPTNNTKQAAWVAVGSLCSFGFTIVSSMILSRYFNKADYGTYKQVMYVYNTLLTVFTLGLPKAFSYFLPRVELAQSKSLINKITRLFFLLGGTLSLLLLGFAPQIAAFLKNPDLVKALRVFALVPFLMLPTMGLDGILATFKQTKFLALYNILTNVFKLLCVALPVMIWDLGYVEALWGFVGASFITFLLAIYLKYLPVKNQPKEKTDVSYKEIFKFSLPLLTASIWGILINSTDQFFISRYFGTEVFAEFSNGALELPFVGMIIGACSTVLTPLFSRQVYKKADFNTTIYPVWQSSFAKSAMLLYPIVVFCIYDAVSIMTVLYGEQYAASGTYFQVRLTVNFVKIVSYYSVLMAIGATRFYSRAFAVFFFVMAAMEYLCVKIFPNPIIITVIHSALTITNCLVFIAYIARYFKISFFKLFPMKELGKVIGMSLLSIAIVWLSKYIYHTNLQLVQLIIDFIVFCIAYFLLSLWLKIDYIKIIKPLFSKTSNNNTK